MTFYVENETDETFSNGENSFPIEETVEQVATAVLDMEGCPYEIQLNVLLTDNDGIHAYNKEYRKIDRETDVLSFPNLDFDEPGDFEISEDREADYFDPDTGELILGDITGSKSRRKAMDTARRESSHFWSLTVCFICVAMTIWKKMRQR